MVDEVRGQRRNVNVAAFLSEFRKKCRLSGFLKI